MNPFLRYLADAHRQTDAHTDRQTDRHTPLITIPCGLRRAGNHAIKHNKPTQYQVLFGLGFMEMIPSSWLGFLKGVFLANHLASNDNLNRTTKRQNIY